MKRVTILLLVLFLGLAFSYDWIIQTVDSAGEVGQYSSLSLDCLGNPHICYCDEHNNDLRYAFFDGTIWHYDTVDAAGDVGNYCDIVIGADNHPHISYYDKSNERLKYAYFNGVNWNIEVAEPEQGVGGEYTSIVLDSADIPYISYYDKNNHFLKMAFKPFGFWFQSIVDHNASNGKYTSIAIGTDNHPRISYYADNSKKLRFAKYNGTSWNFETPDPGQNVGTHTSLVLDDTDTPSISYYDFSNRWLKRAQRIGVPWTIDTVDNLGEVGEYTSIALDSDGNSVISYYDRQNKDLKFAYDTGTIWEKEIVDSLGDVGKFTSCKIRAGNTIYISYYDEENKNLKIAITYGDTLQPGPPENLTANASNPSPWTNNPKFEIDWQNPPDSSGIMRSLYKLGTAPMSNYDTTGTMSGIPPDSAAATIESGQMLYLWLVDSAGYVDYQNHASVELRYDGTAPAGSEASSPLYSTTLDFTVNWTSGNDTGGSGLSGAYDVKIKVGNGPWTTWLVNYSGLSAVYPGVDGHLYYFEVSARDNAGNIEIFTGEPECSTIVDTTKPSIISTYPADADTDIVVNTDISAVFSEPLDSMTLITANFLISGSASGNHTFVIDYNSADSAVYLDPDLSFAVNETVTVIVKKEVTDIAGNMMKNDKIWSFSVGSIIDTLGPITSFGDVSPNPTEPIANLTITGSISDAGKGDNIVNAAEFFVDVPGSNGTGYSMSPVDSFWDEIDEDVIKVFDNESLGWSVDDTHSVFIHGKDGPGNWGDFDTVEIIAVPDDDTLGPTFSDFSPTQSPDTVDFYIECQIIDPSWVYDDSTGSGGQGVYLLWDNDGEIILDANEVKMSHTTGNKYRTDSLIPIQEAATNFVYEMYAYDDDFDTGHPGDRTQASSGLQSVIIVDVRGPNTSNVVASPNPTSGATRLVLTALISDSLLGNSIVFSAEYFINSSGPDSTGRAMQATDGLFDEIIEEVTDTIDISAWQYGTSRWVYVHGIDVSGYWGDFDSILVVVSDVSDTIPPWIASISPECTETDVALNTWIYATFTEKVDPATVTNDKILIAGSVGGVYDLWMSYNYLDSTVSIKPLDDFAPLESVNVYIASGITDLAGNYMPTEYWWWFKTGKGPDTLPPIVDAIHVVPEVVLQGDLILLTGSISDDKGVVNAEYFIDSMGVSGTGYSVIPVDSFGAPSVDIFDTLYTETLSIGKHNIFLHGVDASANWGDYDSAWVYVGEEDSTSPIFDVEIEPSPAFIGDTVQITVIPNELLHPDSSVICSLMTADSMICTMPLLLDSLTFVGTLSTVGFIAGDYTVKVSGYDIWSNHGFSLAACNIGTAGEFLPENMVYAWPNPVKGNNVHFHFYVNANADITIDIYNLEGKRIKRLRGRGEGGRPPHQESSNAINWNISNIASDVYIFRLYAVSDETGEKVSVFKKLAVVK